MKVNLQTKKFLPKKSLPKTLGLTVLLATSALSPALANNSLKKLSSPIQTELLTQNNPKTDSLILAQQKTIKDNEKKLEEQKQAASTKEQIKRQEKIIKQQELAIKTNEMNQKISDFYSKNKKSFWGGLIGGLLLLYGLYVRHVVHRLEKIGGDCSQIFGPDNLAYRIYARKYDSEKHKFYTNDDTRNIFQKAVDYLIDKGPHYTVEQGFTYTPFRNPDPIDPIKSAATWELQNMLLSNRMDIIQSKSVVEQHKKNYYGTEPQNVAESIRRMEKENAAIIDELRRRGADIESGGGDI